VSNQDPDNPYADDLEMYYEFLAWLPPMAVERFGEVQLLADQFDLPKPEARQIVKWWKALDRDNPTPAA
jgi:hypothetical protein